MALLLKNAHVVDPSVELDGVVDVLIDGDKIAEVGEEAALRAALCAFLAELPPDHLGRLCQSSACAAHC